MDRRKFILMCGAALAPLMNVESVAQSFVPLDFDELNILIPGSIPVNGINDNLTDFRLLGCDNIRAMVKELEGISQESYMSSDGFADNYLRAKSYFNQNKNKLTDDLDLLISEFDSGDIKKRKEEFILDKWIASAGLAISIIGAIIAVKLTPAVIAAIGAVSYTHLTLPTKA